ncbi:MAG: hypothetical protein QME93_04380 [Bacillota bacterium]|nr:hypothetical protein [Bacillota bacterium]MDI7249287.1 hypothetical protein [Bacillota bacterium]
MRGHRRSSRESLEDVVELIRELKEADLGVSVVISGLHDVVEDMVRQPGLKRIHTREFSLGSHGRLELLPEYEILEFTTMCGHAMVASGLVKHMIAECKLGRAFAVRCRRGHG